ncbi:MAG TPA: hypothetical protein VGE20_14345 [Ramlibacter sp.]
MAVRAQHVARDATGRWALVGLVAFPLAIHAGNLFGAPPPSVEAIASVGQAQWLLVAWGCWVDGHRRRRRGRPPGGRRLFNPTR